MVYTDIVTWQGIEAYIEGASIEGILGRIDSMAAKMGGPEVLWFSKHMSILATRVIGIQPMEIRDMGTVDYRVVWNAFMG